MHLKNRVVVRYRDGRKLKGFTWDFVPQKEIFHISDEQDERKITEVAAKELKAVFFVRTFAGNRLHKPDYTLEAFARVPGLKLKVTFEDGEVLYGTTNAYSSGRKGFFLLPADRRGNNERVYVFAESTKSIEPMQAAPAAAAAAKP
jgi:hypothetical protein